MVCGHVVKKQRSLVTRFEHGSGEAGNAKRVANRLDPSGSPSGLAEKISHASLVLVASFALSASRILWRKGRAVEVEVHGTDSNGRRWMSIREEDIQHASSSYLEW